MDRPSETLPQEGVWLGGSQGDILRGGRAFVPLGCLWVLGPAWPVPLGTEGPGCGPAHGAH